MRDEKLPYLAAGHQVRRDLRSSRSHKNVLSLHTQPFVSWSPDARTNPRDQMPRRLKTQQTPLMSTRLFHNRCASFPARTFFCHIDGFPPRETKHCSHPIGSRSYKLSSSPVSPLARQL